jgi:transcriptional regulator with XRE-family HTH domain
MQSTLSQFGYTIKNLRIKNHLSQEELAKILKVDKAYISRIEGGKKNVTLQTIEKLATALGVQTRDLFR